MKLQVRILTLGLVFSVLYFILDAAIGSTYYKELSFFQVLLSAPPYHELYSRLIAIALMVIFGILVNSFINSDQKSVKTDPKYNKISADPMLMVNLSNHIRTPLNAIQGFIELLNDTGLNESSKHLYLNHIRTSSKYLLELINNVTDITLIEGNALFLDDDSCKMNEMMAEIHAKYSSVLKDKDKSDVSILLKTNVRSKDFIVNCDSKRLKQVIENLLENATSFTEKGVIEFGYNASNDSGIEFFVKDSGSGFSKDRIDRIFSKTKSIIDNRMVPFDLASLRIKIAVKLVEIMGGNMKVDSVENERADFLFHLPLQFTPLSESGLAKGSEDTLFVIEKEAQKDKLIWANKTILIAEDVESNFIYLQEILKETGARILWANNGKIAYETAMSNSSIDIILMDILMPEMDGYEAAIKIREKLPDLPIIAQTAYHLDESDYKDARHYFDKVLIKPIWSHDLMAALGEKLNAPRS